MTLQETFEVSVMHSSIRSSSRRTESAIEKHIRILDGRFFLSFLEESNLYQRVTIIIQFSVTIFPLDIQKRFSGEKSEDQQNIRVSHRNRIARAFIYKRLKVVVWVREIFLSLGKFSHFPTSLTSNEHRYQTRNE